ncbi:hypothetical protein F8160_00285 [Bacillus sp. CH126_4D]|uniref:hypothetical protein n=1 Tax=unclassified Bacillus (in: firmicutes) TaxID=185979 RepID=UPI00124F00FD|nr:MULTISPECIES: hypothetical protein [unclassified Bacillus (in: firmicutes)]KAB2460807.1 hypothetical protein F8162_00950 [Bacillus sp. CH140a_4T]KAB2476451.1 hypothetical protein F8160_00285 [Bacillus sp. CH126_4D]
MSGDLKGNINQKNDRGFDVSWLFLFLAIVSPFMGLLLIKGFSFKFDDLGTYGDFLGGSTIPFLTIFTMFFIYRTYKLQHEQLKTQQRELSLLQKEMESTKETLQEQSKTAKMQRFENSFFIQIDELRKSKVEAVAYLKMAFGETYYTFNEWMGSITLCIDKSMINSLKDPSKKLPGENEVDKYFDEYGDLLSAAIDESGIYDNDVIPSFFSSVNRSLRLIYEYKNSMDTWEVDFYLDYLYQEIGRESINIILYGICMNKQMVSIAQDLTFNKFADVNYKYARRQDFRFINYVLHDNPDYSIVKDK